MEVAENSSALESTAPVTETASTPDVSSPPPTDSGSIADRVMKAGEIADPSPGSSEVKTQAPYQPNLKFTAGKKEHQLPDYLATVITDDKREKELKEVWEKAQGIDFVKQERARVQEDYKQLRTMAEPLFQTAQQINYFKQQGNIVGAIEALGISKQDLMKAAVQLAEQEQLPPDQKAVYDKRYQAERMAYELEQRNLALQYQYENVLRTQTQNEIESALSTPDIASVASAFDQRNGEGAFRAELIEMGKRHHQQYGVDLPAKDLAKQVINRYGWTQSQTQATPPQVQAANPRMPGQVPVIPNTGSGQVSPASRSPRSIADLRKIANEKFAE